jgi:hypothetical protein
MKFPKQWKSLNINLLFVLEYCRWQNKFIFNFSFLSHGKILECPCFVYIVVTLSFVSACLYLLLFYKNYAMGFHCYISMHAWNALWSKSSPLLPFLIHFLHSITLPFVCFFFKFFLGFTIHLKLISWTLYRLSFHSAWF